MIEGTPLWMQIVYMVVTALVAALLLPYLKRKAQAASEELKTLQVEGVKAGIEARVTLVAELKQFLFERAVSIAEKEFPKLAGMVLKQKLGTDAIKNELHRWGNSLKLEALDYFKGQGVDLLAAVGDSYLDKAIEYVANRVSPFPGKDTAVELAKEKVSNMIIEKGVDIIREKLLSEVDKATED